MGTLWQDIRYGARMLGRNPGFTAVAVLTLALGIGANTAIFSVVNAVLIRPAPFRDPDRLVVVHEKNLKEGWTTSPVSPANFLDWKDQNRVFEQMEAWRVWFYTLAGRDGPEQVPGARVTPGFLSLFGIEVALGRTFLFEEGLPGRDRVVILTHALWQRRFGGDTGIVGKQMTIDGQPFAVVGVLPRDFRFYRFFMGEDYDLWMPLVLDRSQASRTDHSVSVYARLKPGVNPDKAQAEMNAISRRLELEYPVTNAGWDANVIPFREALVRDVRPALWLLLGAVGFLLLIACGNVASLLLARAVGRQKEMAVRAALGAGRGRLVRQMVTESLLLASLGGSAGVIIAYWGVELIPQLIPGRVPDLAKVEIDGLVLGFAMALSLFTGVFFGLAPALGGSKLNLVESLKDGRGTGTQGSHAGSLRSVLVMSEVALAMVLLVGAGLMTRSFFHLLWIDRGLETHNVLTAQFWLPESKYRTGQKVSAFYRDLLGRIRSLPGVQSASAISFLPLSGWGAGTAFRIEGRPTPTPGEDLIGDYRIIDPDYFRTMKVPLRKGRFFTEQDLDSAPRVAIINEAMARRFWPGEDPIGKRIRPEFPESDAPWLPHARERWYSIVGVVANVRENGIDFEPQSQMLYLPYLQAPSSLMSLVVRVRSDPLNLASAVRIAVRAVDKDQPFSYVRTMDEVAWRSFSTPRFSMVLLGVIAALALVLAAVGIYGVISYFVSERTHEIGIRTALGAQHRDVLRLVVGQGMKLALVGVAVGVGAALALTRLISSFLYEVSPTDPATFLAVSGLLTGVALLACYIPARRATKVDPMIALRYE